MNLDLFGHGENDVRQEGGSGRPLADRVRPRTLDDLIGHTDVLGGGGFLRQAILGDELPSLILWGPPGCGKTSIAQVIAHATKARFVMFSAVLNGVKDVRAIVDEAEISLKMHHRKTILFVDEIHRFNRAQQDAFLPHVEAGTITLIGATTENPFFEVNAPLLSRCRVVKLSSLNPDSLVAMGRRAIENDDEISTTGGQIDDENLRILAEMADGDGRRLLNLVEDAFLQARRMGSTLVDKTVISSLYAGPSLRYDNSREEHYNTISAFIKSMRGSSPDAAIYYMVRMLDGGEDPGFICRRMIIFAGEDIGNADPRALQIAVSAKDAYEYLGMPEAEIPMAQACTYLASAPKSNASYKALRKAQEVVRSSGSQEIPMNLVNAPAKGMNELGYGKDYEYPHDHENSFVNISYFPKKLGNPTFYEPKESGYEKTIRERLEWLRCK